MRVSALFMLTGLVLLAGCAAPQPVARPAMSLAQQGVFPAKVLAVRPVSGGLALAGVMKALGESDAGPAAAAQEIVVQMPDGSVKSLVSPPGTAMAGLAPGADILIREMPQLRLTAR